MTATVSSLSGHSPATAAAFGRALDLIAANVAREAAPERAMREVRHYLALAHGFEVGRQIELADACGAIAANKLARAIRVAE